MYSNDNGYKWIPYIALLVIALMVLAVVGLMGGTGAILSTGASARGAATFREVARGVSFDAAGGAVFHADNSAGYVLASRGGVRFIGANGDISQEYVFTLDNVHLYANRAHFIVYEPGGSDARVFSPSGMLYHRNLGGQILSAGVNGSGASAFVVKAGDVYETHLFERDGLTSQAVSRIVHADDGVFPTSAAVSEDGQVAAVALLDVSGANLRSRLAFYHLGEQAGRYSGGIFARLQFEDEVVGRLMFFDDGSLVVFSDRYIRRIGFTGGVVAETGYIRLGNRVASLTRAGGGGFAVVLGGGFTGMDSETPGTVISYTSALTERFRFNPERNTTYLWANDNAVVVGAGRSIYGKTHGGRLLWNYNATQDYSQVIMLENRDTILFAARNEARVLRRAAGFGLGRV
ncbi:MAG: DUF5711 family protein [Defluviitaleaceae bacterium]|nr:DUF5711 family protein [Defluviitaleaceae bacterium]